jgi:hypothetical protein
MRFEFVGYFDVVLELGFCVMGYIHVYISAGLPVSNLKLLYKPNNPQLTSSIFPVNPSRLMRNEKLVAATFLPTRLKSPLNPKSV